jgi:cytochrome c553
MIRLVLLFSTAAALCAQDAGVVRGEKVFQTNCSVPYCHGPNGTAGRAPRLAGHNFTARDLYSRVFNGIPDTAMPAFGAQLNADDISAVVSYVMDAISGKALFFDATRMGGCGRCHELEERGSRVASDLKAAAAHSDLHSIEVHHVITAQPAGESAFPAVVAEKSEKRIRVFDLSSPLPVLRTFAPDAVQLTEGSTWNHRDAVRDYRESELQDIEKYLQSAVAAK